MVIALVGLSGPAIVSRLFAVFLLIGINAFFVTAEFSIVSVRRSRISQLVSEGDAPAKTVQRLQRSIDRLLSTTQLGITLSSLALGWIGEDTMAVILAAWMAYWPLPEINRQILAHSLSIPFAFFLIAYLQIVLGELCPKSVALLYPEQLARVLGPPSWTIARLFNPFIWILNQSTRLLLRAVGVQYTNQFGYSRLTPEELQLIISTSTESPGLDAEERELLNNVFEFRDVTTAEVMVPRTQVAAVPEDASFREVLSVLSQSGYSRYPVTGESLDDICGLIDLKELLQPLAENQVSLDSPIKPWLRPARFVPKYTPVHELLHVMQRTGQEMVMVVDEFGGTAGLVTLRDVTAEIIGDVYEPSATPDQQVKMLEDQSFLMAAQIDLEEVNELLNVNLPLDEDYQTLGGFMIDQLQRIPQVGEKLVYGGLEWTVISAEGPRLQEIHVRPIVNSAPVLPSPASPPLPSDSVNMKPLHDDRMDA